MLQEQQQQEEQQQEQRRQLLATLAKNLKLAPGQEAALAVGLAQSPEPGVAKVGRATFADGWRIVLPCSIDR